MQDHTYTALDYADELDDWTAEDFYEKHVHKIQLPFVQVGNGYGRCDANDSL